MRPPAGCLGALFLLSSSCYATVYSATGPVDALHSQDSPHDMDLDWISLAGVASLGACKTADSGTVVFLVPNERMFELALASRTTGTPLTIWVDDTVTGPSGFCVISRME